MNKKIIIKDPYKLEKIWEKYIKQMNKRGLKGLSKFNFVRHFYAYSKLYTYEWGYLGGDMIGNFIVPSHIVIYKQKEFIKWLKNANNVAFLVPDDLGSMLSRAGFFKFPLNLNIEWNGRLVTKNLYVKKSIKGIWGVLKYALNRKKFDPNVEIDWEDFDEWVEYFYNEEDYYYEDEEEEDYYYEDEE